MTGAEVSLGSHFSGALWYGLEKDKSRVEWMEFWNVSTHSVKGAAMEMQAVASQSRCEKPVYHTSLNWAPEDNPTEAEMREVAHRYLEHMGLDRNQVLLVAHNDTDHPHVHIMANRVFPDGHPNQHRAWELDTYNGQGRERKVDKFHNQRVQEFLEGVEKEYGWREVGGKYRATGKEKTVGRSLKDHEYHREQRNKEMAAGMGIDPEKIDGRAVLERAKEITDELFQATSFRTFDEALSKRGLWLDMARNKKGMIICGGTQDTIKASSISRQLSGPQLEKKFGRSLKSYVYEREQQLKELDGMVLAVNWRSGMIEEELQTLEMILNQNHRSAEKQVRKLKKLDEGFTREIKREYELFDMKWDQAFENGKAARRAFNKKMHGKPMEEWVPEGQDRLSENPEQFGAVREPGVVTQMSRDLQEMERLAGEYQKYFTEGLSKEDRQALIEHARHKAKQLVSSMQRVDAQISQHLREQMNDPDVYRAVRRGYNEALSLWRAVSQIQKAYRNMDMSDNQISPLGRNPELDGKMAEAIKVLDQKLDGYYADPTKARVALWDIMWDDKSKEVEAMIVNSDEFGVRKGNITRGELKEALQAPKQIRKEFKGFLSELEPDQVEAYFRHLPEAMKARSSEHFQALSPAAVTGLELVKSSSRWLSRASGTEAGRAVFSMSARAVKVSASIAMMLKNPAMGSLSLAKGIMKDAIQQANGPERRKDLGLDR
ncbi:relaxase/mobilization nuclease domain-containing protein [Fodinibius sediminis]|uniref:Relaxase/Mobilisation nuclease domain-containing protein n=1 Tax=Fodinibius sediminis TaxID=1214077 RepID=A0A521CBW7_9BACT|nr:relaxase/mobilization nuclease domain-containing protein [Fodinibius sediminis]SMO56898.1 Relaxase/Mobilisation nuclease domain-containing protein [Fodinibius sediminis]